MEIERMAKDAWAIPQMCCACGEPGVDGKPHRTSVTLDRTRIRAGLLNEVDGFRTTSLQFDFPRCAACDRAQRAKARGNTAAAAVGALVGFTGCIYAISAEGGALPWLIFILVWFGVAFATQQLVDWRWNRSADEDTKRRAALARLPVEVKKIGRRPGAQVLKFEFANEKYGETFSALNP